MRISYLITLILTIIVTTVYVHKVGETICPVPLSYAIGTIDPQFAITSEELRQAAERAEASWEQLTDRELFVYDESAAVTINLVFDERHEQMLAEQEFQSALDRTESVSDAVRAEYEALVVDFESKRSTYEAAQKAYAVTLARYNERVSRVNEAGGATPKEYAVLEIEADALEQERLRVNRLADEVNILVGSLNALRDQNNQLISVYNQGVREYNETFGGARSFTQGVFRTDGVINIFTFASLEELQLVIVHEFGHALGIDHVENPESLMYYELGEQSATFTPSSEDAEAFSIVCAKRGVWDTIVAGYEKLFIHSDSN